MDRNDIIEVYTLTCDSVFRKLISQVRGWIDISYDIDQEKIFITIKRNEVIFNWTIHDVWGFISGTRKLDDEIVKLIGEYRKYVTRIYFKY